MECKVFLEWTSLRWAGMGFSLQTKNISQQQGALLQTRRQSNRITKEPEGTRESARENQER